MIGKNMKRGSFSRTKLLLVLVALLISFPFVFGSDFVPRGNSVQAFDFSAGLGTVAVKVGLKNGGELGLPVIIGAIIYSALGLIGVVFLMLVVLAGLRWMTAGGNEEKVTKAKGSLTNAAVGVLVVLGAYAITYFVINKLLGG